MKRPENGKARAELVAGIKALNEKSAKLPAKVPVSEAGKQLLASVISENNQRLNNAVAAIAKDQKIDWPNTYKLHIDGAGYSESEWRKV